MIGIVIATYQRPDGKTPFYLERTLKSINNQTFKDYHVYLIGDAYINEGELISIARRHRNITCYNLDHSPERDRYGHGNMQIWCAGGVTAANKGIELALADGCNNICHLGHDDFWKRNHLELINRVIQEKHPVFICTISTYVGMILPDMPLNNKVIPFYPVDSGIIASAVCIDYSKTNLRVIDRFALDGITYPCDAWLWVQLKQEMEETGKEGYLICTLTCHHDEQGYSMK
jgi:hypothetical protein